MEWINLLRYLLYGEYEYMCCLGRAKIEQEWGENNNGNN